MSYKSRVEDKFMEYERGDISFNELKLQIYDIVDELKYNFKTYPELTKYKDKKEKL